MIPEINQYMNVPLDALESVYNDLIPELTAKLADTWDPLVNLVGSDLEAEMLAKIDQVFDVARPKPPVEPICDATDPPSAGYWGALSSLAGSGVDPSWKLLARLRDARQHPEIPDQYEEAQIRELAFWRWVAYHGYLDSDPRCFPLWQRRAMLGAYAKTGWSLDRFAGRRVVEIGCGPLGMLEFIPARQRVGFDPLNPHYGRLFSKIRSPDIEYVDDLDALVAQRKESFDLGICYNVIDHTDAPRELFDAWFSLIRPGGTFLFEVNLVDLRKPRSAEHTRMHPSTFDADTVRAWIADYADDVSEFMRDELSPDNEYFFMLWGRKRGPRH